MNALGDNGQITLDGEWLTIERDGWSRLGHVEADKRIRVDAITCVKMHRVHMLGSGFIAFETADHKFKGSVDDARRDDNTVIFTRKQKTEFEELQAALRRLGAAG